VSFFRRNWWAIGVLAVLPVLMLLPALLPGKALLPAAMLGNMSPWKSLGAFPQPSPWNPLQFDGIAQFYPWRLFAAETLKSGYLPLWNPFQFCGTPFLANDQSAVLYPPNLLFVVLPVAKAFGASAVLHLFLTGMFLYALLRRRVEAVPALLGAIVWQLSAWQISWLALPTFLCTSTWIPLVLLQIERCAEKPIAGRGVALGAVIGVMLLAGHLQVALYGLTVGVAYGLTLIGADSSLNSRARVLGVFAIAAGLAAMLFAAQILPTLELAHGSHRAGGAHPSLAGFQAYDALRMPWYHLVTLFAPAFFGRSVDYWGVTNFAENACFVSIAALVLALAAVTMSWRGPRQLQLRFFAIVASVALSVALGTPLAGVLYFGVPGFGQTGSPARILVLWALSMAVLAAFGLEALQTKPMPKATAWVALAIIAGPLIGAVKYVQANYPAFLDRIGRADIIASIGIAVLVCLGVAALRRPGMARVASCALVALTAIDLFRAGFGYNLAADAGQIYPTTPAISFLQTHAGADRIVPVNDPGAVYEHLGAVLPPNASTVFGLRDLQGYDSLQTGQYKALINRIDAHDSSPLENGNMTLTYASAAFSRDARDLADVAWIVTAQPISGFSPEPTGDSALYIYAEPGPSSGRARTMSPNGRTIAAADIVEDIPTRFVANSRVEGDFVVADQWYPGWRARVNGTTAPIVEGPGVFRTVRDVPANSTISMIFEPPAFRLGQYLLDAAMAVIAGFLVGTLRRKREIEPGASKY
jgi:hypothetical protein